MATYGEALTVKELSITLRGKIKEKNYHPSKSYHLIDVFDDLTIAWSKEDGCFYSQINCFTSSENFQPIVQVISISKPPIWEVLRISINKGGSGILIWGCNGLAVMELPKRWGNPCLFEGGAKSMTCRVVYVGENYFTSTSKLCILSASWHPGCLSHNHVAILSNDNYFRVYNLANPNAAEISISVGKPNSLIKDSSTLNCDAVTGELAVDFDFGAAIFPDNFDSADAMDDPEERRKRYLQLLWPVFFLYSGGDICYSVVSIFGKKADNRTLYGPMLMLPAAYDNYGLDYCCLIVLPCTPQVLVIANSSANIHHCVVLEKSLLQDLHPLSIESLTQRTMDLQLKAPNYILHVYESIKLDLSFAGSDPKTNSNMLLIADHHMPSRYWISHFEGIHGVSFPLVDRLVHFEGRNIELELSNDEASSVEHFLCTKPISSVKPLPVIGLAFNRSPPSVFVLLGSGLIYTFPIPTSFQPCISNSSGSSDKDLSISGDSFLSHIQNILHRSTSQPLLLSGSVPDIESEEYLCMIASAVKCLKQNYMMPQVKAREEMQMRVNILLEQKNNVLIVIETLLRERNPLKERAHLMAEKYEDANERHSRLLGRLEKIMSRIVSDLPTLSGSERAMVNELTAMKDRGLSTAQDISKLQAKHNWQMNEIKKQKSREASANANLSAGEVTSIRDCLNSESRRLKIMSKKLLQLKSEVDM